MLSSQPDVPKSLICLPTAATLAVAPGHGQAGLGAPGLLARALPAASPPGRSAQRGLCQHSRRFRQAPPTLSTAVPHVRAARLPFPSVAVDFRKGVLCAPTRTSSELSPAPPGRSLHAGQDPAGFCLAWVSSATPRGVLSCWHPELQSCGTEPCSPFPRLPHLPAVPLVEDAGPAGLLRPPPAVM